MNKVTIPAQERGNWRIEQFTVESGVGAIRFAWQGRAIPVGETFTRLMYGNTLVMSDTPAEMRDHFEPVLRAHGSCLINGLGLGMVLQAVLDKDSVTDVTVVEKSEEVIAMVAPFYPDPRVTIIHADAFEYVPEKGKRFCMVWHDIWDYMCSDNLPEMTRLKRKYGRRSDWQGAWGEWQCREQLRQYKR